MCPEAGSIVLTLYCEIQKALLKSYFFFPNTYQITFDDMNRHETTSGVYFSLINFSLFIFVSEMLMSDVNTS